MGSPALLNPWATLTLGVFLLLEVVEVALELLLLLLSVWFMTALTIFSMSAVIMALAVSGGVVVVGGV